MIIRKPQHNKRNHIIRTQFILLDSAKQMERLFSVQGLSGGKFKYVRTNIQIKAQSIKRINIGEFSCMNKTTVKKVLYRVHL